MKTEIILVPEGKCPLDSIAELGERTRNSIIFLHLSAVQEIMYRADSVVYGDCIPNLSDGSITCHWSETDKYPETLIKCRFDYGTNWATLFEVAAADIAYTKPAEEPDEIFFIKMDE